MLLRAYLAVGCRSNASIEFFAFQHEKTIVGRDDAALQSNRPGRVHVVTRDHAHGDTSATAFGNCTGYFWPNRIFDATDANARQLLDDAGLVVPVGQPIGREVSVGDADRTQTVAGHGLDDRLHDSIVVDRGEWNDFAVAIQDALALLQNDLRGALGVHTDGAVGPFDARGHVLA